MSEIPVWSLLLIVPAAFAAGEFFGSWYWDYRTKVREFVHIEKMAVLAHREKLMRIGESEDEP